MGIGNAEAMYQMQKTLTMWQPQTRDQLVQAIDNTVIGLSLQQSNLL